MLQLCPLVKTKMASTKENKKDENVSVAKTPAELQRMRLDKLMKNPTKPVYIPDPSKAPKMKDAPEFIRNVWGSSAGAGSGDFHVYRGVRRREYARQKFQSEMTKKLTADEEYHKKLEENKKAAEEKTAKKRAKRQKKKQKMKNKKMKKDEPKAEDTSEEEDDEEDREEETEDRNEEKDGQKNEDKSGNCSHQASDKQQKAPSDLQDES